MCGRFFIDEDWNDIFKGYGLTLNTNEMNFPNGEIFPTNNVPAIINNGTKKIIPLKWGFPIKNKKNNIINARSETILDKPMFRSSFISRRCLIPASAFFEWQDTGFGKIKYKISVKDNNIFSMAGIYNLFTDNTGSPFWSFVIITTDATEAMEEIHNRMPVIIDKQKENLWIDNNTDLNSIQKLLKPYPSSNLIINPA